MIYRTQSANRSIARSFECSMVPAPPSLNPATRFWVNPTMRKGLMLKFSPYALDSFGEDAADAL